MPKGLNQVEVNLAFTADTAEAKKQIQDLQKSLQDLTNNTLQKAGNEGTFNKDMEDALLTVKKLDDALKNALNTSTGRLDLSKLDTEFNKAGLTIEEVRQKMRSLGPEGSQAFLKIANSIMLAEKPMKESSKLLDKFWTALKNTARWQFSSSILHGLMGAMSSAYGYAQDLDKSLNSIRIVSGQSADEMARLAEHANKAAQALSTSTLAYTDAALIYYQQGLDPDEVAKRTETTLRLSNVTGESASEVSSYMTAIWNNFGEGSENIEYFADVITALGAATASSSKEIAGGMQQFAAVANTVGLSYEYAASALATIVAQTRQSESTVGNGLRTIFARFDSVKLGETLEDGVGLTKYTEALQKAGVSVLDQNGQLKEMDQILDAIGEKWETLDKTQRTALAQTVGGVRQYTNLMALFDNWGQFQKNLAVAQGAEGSLGEQAEIYAESWEAARKRVQASWQAIYQDLIDDKFIIQLLNGFEKILKFIDKLIDSIGGLKGVLGTLGSIATFVLQDKMAKGISQGIRGFAQYTGLLVQQDDKMRNVTTEALHAENRDLEYNEVGVEQSRAIQSQIEQTKLLKQEKDKLNEADLKHISDLQYIQNILEKNSELAEKSWNDANNNVAKFETTIQSLASVKDLDQSLAAAFLDDFENAGKRLAEGIKQGVDKNMLLESLTQEISDKEEYADFNLKDSAIKEGITVYQELETAIERKNNASNTARIIEERTDNAIRKRNDSEQESKIEIEATTEAIQEQTEALKENEAQKNKTNSNQQGAVTRAQKRVNTDKQNIANIDTLIAAKTDLQNEIMQTPLTDDRQAAVNRSALIKVTNELNQLETERNQLVQQLSRHEAQLAESTRKLTEETQQESTATEQNTADKNGNSDTTQQVVNAEEKEATARDQNEQSTKEETDAVEKNTEAKKKNKDVGAFTDKLGAGITKAAAMLSSIQAQTAAIDRLQEIWSDESLSNLDKFKSSLGGATSILMQFGRMYSQFGGGKTGFIAAAAVTVTSLAIDGLQAAYQKYYETTAKGKLDTANKILKETEENAKKAKNAYIEYTSALEEYKKVQKEIAAMPAGEERAEAIAEENDKILELIEKYNLLDKISILEYDNNGLLILDESLKLELQKEKSKERQAAYQAKINQLIAESNAEAASSKVNKLRVNGADGGLVDITQDIAKVLNEAGLGLGAVTKDKNAVIGALTNSDNEDIKNNIPVIIGYLERIASNPEQAALFTELSETLQNLDNKVNSYQMLNARTAIGNELSDVSSVAKVQQSILETYAEAESDIQEKILTGIEDGGLTLVEAFKAAGVDIAEIIKNATREAAQEAADKAATVYQKEGELTFSNDKDIAEKQINFIMSASEEQLAEYGGLAGLQKAIDKIAQEHNIELKVQASDFTQLKSSVKDDDLMAEVQEFADYIQEHAKDITGLSAHLADCRKESERLAYAIMRFDDAIQDVTTNYKDWSEALAAGGMRAASVLRDLEKAYGNVLDIDGSLLSSKFTEDINNLNDMKAAIEGNEAAYNRLQIAAGQDYMANTLDVDTQYANGLVSAIQSVQDALNQLDVGSVLDPNMFASIYSAFDQLIQNTEMTVEEFNALAGMLGFSADVITDEREVEDENQAVDQESEVVPSGESYPSVITNAGDTGGEDYHNIPVYNLRVTGKPHPIEGAKKKTKTVVVGIETGNGKGLHKMSGGQIKYKQATHGGGGVSPSKSSGGGGGKGSTPKEKKKTVKEHKEVKKEEDRYHDLKERIDDVNTALKRMGKTKDRIYGKAKLKYMDQELARMKDQIALTKEYIKEAEKYLKVDRTALEGIKKGAAFDENGMLTNYEEVLKNITEAYNNQLAQYNAAVDKFNASEQEEGDNAAFEAEEKALAKAEKTFEENKKILKQYEDTYNLIQKQQEELIDQLNEYYDTLLENVDIKVKMKIDLEEDDKKLLEWMYKYIGDSADYAADKIANLSKQLQASKKELDIMRAGVEEIFKNHGMNIDVNNLDADNLVAGLRRYMEAEGLAGEMTEAEIEKIREYRDALMQYYDDMYDKFTQVNEVLREVMDEQSERIDKQLEKYDKLAKKVDYYRKIIDLVGQTTLGLSKEEVEALDRTTVAIGMDRLVSATLAAEKAEKERLALLEDLKLAKASNDKDWIKQAQETYDKAEELAENYEQKRLDAHLEVQEEINNSWENSWDLIEAEYKKQLGSLDNLLERYNLQKEVDHLYLDDFEKYHELNNSMKELQKSMNNTNNYKILAKMADLQDDINAAMQAGVKISEVSAEIIARRVALLQAEAELMDAQNAKSAVRMTRDNEGNFSYTYTADQDQINDAEQNYGDKFYELMKFERDSQENYQTEMLQSKQDYIEALRAIDEAYMNDEFATREEYLEAKAQIEELYNEKMYFFHDELGLLFDEQARLYEDDWQDFEDFTGLKLAEQDDFVTEFEQTVVGRMTEGYQTLDGELETWLEVSQKAYGDSVVAGQLWQQQTDAAMTAAKLSIDNFTGQMLLDLQNIDKSSEETKNYIKDMISGPDGMAKKFEEARQKALEFNQDFAKFNQEERDQIQHTVEELNEMIRKLAETGKAEDDLTSKSNITKTAIDKVAEAAQTAAGAFDAMAEAANKAADAANRAANAGKDTGKEIDFTGTGGYGGGGTGGKYDAFSMDTGGYTGDFGPAGKWAILHEKEIVLNKADTANMLNIVGMVRNMVNSFDLNERLDNLLSMATAATGIAGPQMQPLDQNVHIEASFPNVQSHSEIELALNNLINSASQYVNRK